MRATREQAVVREGGIVALVEHAWIFDAFFSGRDVAGLRAVELEHVLGLLRDVHHLGHAHLHPVGQFVLSDARQRLRIAAALMLRLVHLRHRVEHATAHRCDPCPSDH
jgi:hypothetical protein